MNFWMEWNGIESSSSSYFDRSFANANGKLFAHTHTHSTDDDDDYNNNSVHIWKWSI